ncbi:hypothetical protein [Myxococcus sp. Y35]|uniref:hypothetical protein n=1 Tax=Pseudomyxococcus flavus TaxID=3115648 RepID=UPI003CF2F818
MTPIPYDPAVHYAQFESWLKVRDDSMPPETLPQTGFIIPGKAVGFLYRTDSCIAMIENLVAAPGLSKEERSEALDLVVKAIMAEAKKLGFTLLMGYTQLDAVVKRAERLGFTHADSGYHIVAVRLA